MTIQFKAQGTVAWIGQIKVSDKQVPSISIRLNTDAKGGEQSCGFFVRFQGEMAYEIDETLAAGDSLKIVGTIWQRREKRDQNGNIINPESFFYNAKAFKRVEPEKDSFFGELAEAM